MQIAKLILVVALVVVTSGCGPAEHSKQEASPAADDAGRLPASGIVSAMVDAIPCAPGYERHTAPGNPFNSICMRKCRVHAHMEAQPGALGGVMCFCDDGFFLTRPDGGLAQSISDSQYVCEQWLPDAG